MYKIPLPEALATIPHCQQCIMTVIQARAYEVDVLLVTVQEGMEIDSMRSFAVDLRPTCVISMFYF